MIVAEYGACSWACTDGGYPMKIYLLLFCLLPLVGIVASIVIVLIDKHHRVSH
jgi:hypothetical protein